MLGDHAAARARVINTSWWEALVVTICERGVDGVARDQYQMGTRHNQMVVRPAEWL